MQPTLAIPVPWSSECREQHSGGIALREVASGPRIEYVGALARRVASRESLECSVAEPQAPDSEAWTHGVVSSPFGLLRNGPKQTPTL